MTLNILCLSRINPRLSSWAYINGIHNFNKSPLAPPVTKIIVHVEPNKRASWDFRGMYGWYVAPAPDHHRCVTCYIPTIRTQVVSDKIKLIPNYIPFPEMNIDDRICKILKDLTQLLYSKSKPIPAQMTDTSKKVLLDISTLLNRDNADIKKSIFQLQRVHYLIQNLHRHQ